MINNIQFLRGICVLLVVLYHLEFKLFSFGYLGVDVFFIISGYLMPIILPKYTPVGFLRARLMRLAPVLLVMTLACLIVGFFIQMPSEYENTGVSSIYSLFNVSFWFFQQNTGYFDLEAQMQPLLHTWSLGNEVFAYLCLFLMVLFTAGDNKKIIAVSILISIVAALNLMLSPDANYFNPVPRLYLFFAGLVGFHCLNNTKHIFGDRSKVLISAIVASVFLYLFSEAVNQRSWPNPGLLLLPFIVVPLLSLESQLVKGGSANVLLFIGAISYSMYIWHWPIVVFERTYLRNVNLGTYEAFVLLVPIFLASIASYYLVERRFKTLSVRHVSYSAAVVLIFSTSIVLSNGVSTRVPSHLALYSNVEKMRSPSCSLKDALCEIKYPGVDDDILVVGDSHARHFLSVLSNRHGSLTYLNLPMSQLLSGDDADHQLRRLAKELQESRLVYVAYKWSAKSQVEVDAFLTAINSSQHQNIFFIRDVPSYPVDPVACLLARNTILLYKTCSFNPMQGIPLDDVTNSESLIWAHVVNQIENKYRIVETHNALCDEISCVGSFEGELLMRDMHHLNESLSSNALARLGERLFMEQ